MRGFSEEQKLEGDCGRVCRLRRRTRELREDLRICGFAGYGERL